MPAFDPSFLLFVPGDRPDRFDKAAVSGASGIILDLEDAVAIDHKEEAREAVASFLDTWPDISRVAVRINSLQSPWIDHDLTLVAAYDLGAVMIPKVPHVQLLSAVTQTIGDVPLIALIESASGVLHAASIATHPQCIALAFGPYDLAADLGSADDWATMLPYRSQVLLAARAGGKLAIEGPTLTWGDPIRTETEARPSARMGFDGKLLIHPGQATPARKAFCPSQEDIARATRIVEVGSERIPGVLNGMMIDEPMLVSARRILERARICAT